MLYWFFRWVFVLIFRFFYRWEVSGRENIPLTGSFIICSNHISWWDPPLVGSLVSHQPVYFMAKEELFQLPVFGSIMRKIHAFPVKRDSADRRAIRTALDVLKGGNILGLFPEGTRSKTDELLPPQPGVGMIAIKSEAAVLPVGITGPYKLFRPVRVKIGKPLQFQEHYGQKARTEHFEQVAATIMSEIDWLRRAQMLRGDIAENYPG